MREKVKESWDLVGIVLLSLILVLSIALVPEFPLRIIIGLPFLLFFPGYVLIAFLFPERKRLDAIERIALSFGLSIAVSPLIGFGLNYTPFGIRLEPILVCITAFNLAFSFLAYWRRYKVDEPYLPSYASPPSTWLSASSHTGDVTRSMSLTSPSILGRRMTRSSTNIAPRARSTVL
jgi:uncharacterized membrane protein